MKKFFSNLIARFTKKKNLGVPVPPPSRPVKKMSSLEEVILKSLKDEFDMWERTKWDRNNYHNFMYLTHKETKILLSVWEDRECGMMNVYLASPDIRLCDEFVLFFEDWKRSEEEKEYKRKKDEEKKLMMETETALTNHLARNKPFKST